MKSDPIAVLAAPPQWRRLVLVSDLHLGADAPRTTQRLIEWLDGDARRADALLVLGDLFEAWVGDDLLDAAASDAAESRVVAALRAWTDSGRALLVLHGNRDFLLGADFAARCGATLLADPIRLHFAGQAIVLTHGDALCLDDHAYQQWRALCRQPAWQAQALAQPLAARQQQAAALRAASRAAQAQAENWADVDAAEAARWLHSSGSHWMIHGHTHRPRDHWGQAQLRQVLSDWDLDGSPPARAQALWLEAGAGWLAVRRDQLID